MHQDKLRATAGEFEWAISNAISTTTPFLTFFCSLLLYLSKDCCCIWWLVAMKLLGCISYKMRMEWRLTSSRRITEEGAEGVTGDTSGWVMDPLVHMITWWSVSGSLDWGHLLMTLQGRGSPLWQYWTLHVHSNFIFTVPPIVMINTSHTRQTPPLLQYT